MSYLSELLGSSYHEGMTEDEISEAIKGAVGTLATQATHLKGLVTKANGEAAEYRRQLEAAKASNGGAELTSLQEKLAAVEKQNADLVRGINLGKRTNELLAQGYSQELAEKTAAALLDGDIDTVLKNQAAYVEALRKAEQEKLYNNTPLPATGGASPITPKNYADEIAQATASGRYADAAYYTRLQAEAEAEAEAKK